MPDEKIESNTDLDSDKLDALCLADLLRKPENIAKETYVRSLYNALLLRDPDEAGLAAMLRRPDTHNFFADLISSLEFQRLSRSPAYSATRIFRSSKHPRVLLFGAFGNGNLGDAIQAMSLARAIQCVRPDLEVWSCSLLPAPYPFPYHRQLLPHWILNPLVVNSFDLLVIGGGGLFAHPHEPLIHTDWQNMIQIPIALIGVGATEPVAGRSELLIRKAVYVSGRDRHSLSTLQRYAPAVQFIPDPVLSDPFYFKATGRWRAASQSARRLWILRSLRTPDFTELCREIARRGDRVCFFEPHLDFNIVQHVPQSVPIYCAEDALAMIDDADVVLSMRYHGCILSLLRGKQTYGFYEPKCRSLLERYDNEDWFSRELTFPSLSDAPFRGADNNLVSDRQTFLTGLTVALSPVRPFTSSAKNCSIGGSMPVPLTIEPQPI
jgi:hypothetical protein